MGRLRANFGRLAHPMQDVHINLREYSQAPYCLTSSLFPEVAFRFNNAVYQFSGIIEILFLQVFLIGMEVCHAYPYQHRGEAFGAAREPSGNLSAALRKAFSI